MQVISAQDAAKLIQSGSVVANEGFMGIQVAEEIYKALEARIDEENEPRNLTLFHISGISSDWVGGTNAGLSHLRKKGVVKRIIGGHWNILPPLRDQISENQIEGINLPQGVLSQMIRDIAAKRPGTITSIGLNTFVDPRLEGGKVNELAQASGIDYVELLILDGREYLRYKPLKYDVCILRGTYSDEYGNISLEKEAATLNATSLAQATHNCGGTVIVQVEAVVKAGSLDPKLVRIPGAYVDYVVVAGREKQWQTFAERYNPAYSGQVKVPVASLQPLEMGARKVIARRCAMELRPNSFINLGVGIPEGVGNVAVEEKVFDGLNLSIEAGITGGVPASGFSFGAATNPDAIIDEALQFDFYDGGGIDIAFLGFGQCDEEGNVNVSKFGGRCVGCGGFIEISQSSKKVVYCGTFTTGGLKVDFDQGEVHIRQEGQSKKFVSAVDQVTFSGRYAQQNGQPVLFVTERAVFELRSEGLVLTELAPGVDLQRDILGQMDFTPLVAPNLKFMDPALFLPERMGLSSSVTRKAVSPSSAIYPPKRKRNC